MILVRAAAERSISNATYHTEEWIRHATLGQAWRSVPALSSVDKRRHFLPAASIGYFSNALGPAKLRRRRVYVMRKDSAIPFLTSAENCAFGKYTYGYGGHWDWDNYFKHAEVFVHEPVANIMQGEPDGIRLDDWARLAWYAATLITRGPDLEREVTAQSHALGVDPRAASPGYVINAQRAGAAIIRARWDVEWSIDRDFVLGDRGVTGFYHPRWKSFAYHVPLRRNVAVVLGAGPHPKPVRWTGGQWVIELEYDTLLEPGVDWMNVQAWCGSRAETYGPSAEQLQQIRAAASDVPEEVQRLAQAYEGAQLLGVSVHDRMRDELLVLNLVAGTPAPADGAPMSFTI